MALSRGTRLGPYEIHSPLGTGGMGEVYKATDTRLDRTVAIKVLPPELADDTQRRERFEREAKIISGLNHRHICTLHDIGSQDGIDFLVMEHLEGQTLADRLTNGALPLDHALRCAIEIADALDKAHRQGIVHRDLKPGNIMLTKAGAKLLDFGLAKPSKPVVSGDLTAQAPRSEGLSLTGEGQLIGTLHYMAPEQVEGKQADARADIFAFGAVLYEMVTGQKAFEGPSPASVIAAILGADPPPLSTRQPITPPQLEHVVTTCLAKDPDDRWQTASDVMRQLRWITERGAAIESVTPAVSPARPSTVRGWLLGVLGLVLAGVVGGLAVWSLTRPTPRDVVRFGVGVPRTDELGVGVEPGLVLSPDGRTLVYVATRAGVRQLYRRSMDQLNPLPIPGTEGARNPFFSPDGAWIGFFADEALKKVSLEGGPALTLSELVGQPYGACWTEEDTILFAARPSPGVPPSLKQVSAAGGVPQPLAAGQEGELGLWLPQVLPGGDAVLFVVMSGSLADLQIVAQSLDTGDTGERHAVVTGGLPHVTSTGHLVFWRDSSIWAVPFDADRLEVTGEAAPLVEGVRDFTVAGDGSLVYLQGNPVPVSRTLVWVTREGQEEPLAADPRRYSWPRLSPDGRHVAIGAAEGETENIWLYDVERDTSTRLTFEGENRWPVWSPDGSQVVFQSNRAGPRTLYVKPADGSGAAMPLVPGQNPQAPGSWSVDGELLAFSEIHPERGGDIWVWPREGNPSPVLATSFHERSPVLSPDGRWLAYVSNEARQPEVFVQPYPGAGSKQLVSQAGGVEPVWSADGRELLYRTPANQMMVVTVETASGLTLGRSQVLFEDGYFRDPDELAAYDVTPDGQRFLMMKRRISPQDASAARDIVVVRNWFEELKTRVPTAR